MNKFARVRSRDVAFVTVGQIMVAADLEGDSEEYMVMRTPNSLGDNRLLRETSEGTTPDGLRVRELCNSAYASMAWFALRPGRTSHACRHADFEEFWYVLSGGGELWRENGGTSEILAVQPGQSFVITAGSTFQFRATGTTDLAAIAVTIPPFEPGGVSLAQGLWPSTDSETTR